MPFTAGADSGSSNSSHPTYVAPGVLQAAKQGAPTQLVHVIIQSVDGESAARNAFDKIEKAAEEAQRIADRAKRIAANEADQARRAKWEAEFAARAEDLKARLLESAGRRSDRVKQAMAAYRAAKAAADREIREAMREFDQAKRAAQDAENAQDDAEQLAADTEGSLQARFVKFGMVAVGIPAARLPLLQNLAGLTVTLDAPVKPLAAKFTAKQLWPHQAGAAKLWPTDSEPGPKLPAIAIVDSGIDTSHASFGPGRVVRREVFSSLVPNSPGDGRGHGTFVAGMAAGGAPDYAGVAPNADLIDLDVMDDRGMARTSDVIRACEWILQNRQAYNIRVANFSLHSSSVVSIRHHPLNRVVEKLWFEGVVVVAAAGNYGIVGGPSGVNHAPGNDPFVITVGAFDLDGSAKLHNHDIPSWSAYGFTNEGFSKPDVIAAGRYLVGPVPAASTLVADKPDKVVGPGWIKLSGTSFASPIVAGIAAQILARHPEWTPDQVKGALMMTSRRIPEATRLQQGRGEVNAVRAIGVRIPGNPNASLNRFVVSESGGSGKVFDAAAWYDALRSDAAWDSAAWADAAWADAAWADAAWADAAWADAAWNDAAWADAAWADSTSYEDNAEGEVDGATSPLTAEEAAELAADPALALPGEVVVLNPAPLLPPPPPALLPPPPAPLP